MGKTVLITGSSSGIGKASARYFQEKGWNVAATMRSPEKEIELNKLPNVKVFRLDVLDKKSINNAIDAAIKEFSSIEVIVNNAGNFAFGPFEAATSEQIERQFAVNLFGLMDVTRAILPYFRERKGGTIINVSSEGGRLTLPLMSVYHSTKFAIEGFSESLHFELKEHNIKVKIVEPGFVKTNFLRSMVKFSKSGLGAYDTYTKKVYRALETVMGRIGAKPEEVAKVIYRAAMDDAHKLRYIACRNAQMSVRLCKFMPQGIYDRIVEEEIEQDSR